MKLWSDPGEVGAYSWRRGGPSAQRHCAGVDTNLSAELSNCLGPYADKVLASC